MNNLTTRRIVLGLLMTFVLVFGVQGVADAVGDPGLGDQSNADVITNRLVGSEFDLSFSNYTPTGEKVSTTETVTITISSGITLSEPVHSTSSVTLREKEVVDFDDTTPGNQRDNGPFFHGNTEITGTINVVGHFTSAGKKTVTVKGTAYANGGAGTPWSYTFTYYVTQPTSDRGKAFNLQSLTGGYYNTGNFNRASIKIHSSSGNFPVEYTVSGTGAALSAEYPSGGHQPVRTGTTISSALNVYLQMGSATSVVTAKVDGSEVTTRGVYIYGFPTLTLEHPSDPDGDGQTDDAGLGSQGTRAKINSTIEKAFEATVRDGTSDPGATISNVVVKFQVRGSGTAGGYLVFDADDYSNLGALVTSTNRQRLNMNGSSLRADAAKILYVRTDSNGQADVGFEFGTDEKQDVTVSTVGLTRMVSVYTETPDAGPQFTQQSSQLRAGKYDLRATVTDDGVGQDDQLVEFTTSDGALITPATGVEIESNDILPVMTNQRGEVFVVFDPDDTSGAPRVTADLVQPANPSADPATPRRILDSITFNVRGGTTRQPTRPVQQVARLTITTSGEGTTRTVTVNALTTTGISVPGITVTLSSTDFTLTESVTTGTPIPITLPSTPDTYRLFATDASQIYAQGTTTVTVAVPPALGTLSVAAVGAPVNGQQTIEVTVRNADGTAPTGAVTVTLIGAVSRTVDTLGGSGRAIITLPTTATYTLTLSAPGYTTRPVTLSTTGQPIVPAPTPDPTIPIEEPPAAVPSSIQVSGPAARSGTVNQQLDAPLLVRVLDDVGTGVADARVIFRVISGRGKLSERGNGRAVGVQTDSSGYARANFTPTDDGTITVRASTTDISATVTFTITSDDGTPVDDGPADTGEPRSTERTPVVHVGAASRPPMLWVEEGAIYALVGASPQKFAPSVDNALNIAVAGGKVYWTEKTGESGGTINSANLNGSGVTELASIFATPMGIAVDVTNSKLYWTNSAGRIQSANLDGSRITNELQNLASPMDIALAGGNAYWTQGGNVRFVNLRGQKVVRNVSTGADAAGSLVIGGGKVYWTETTGESGGTVNSANLNGTGATQLASILAAPMGIAVDTARSKLFWTNARGRVQSANLDGSKITNVVSGLGSPGELVLSNSIATPTATTTTTRTTTTASKYDLNSDGAVDNADAALVADAMGTSNTKYDVNGDGTVNFLDLLLVFDNRDPGAAGAPTIVGMKLSAAQIDIIEEQIDLLIATNDRSPSAMRVLVYLQQLLVTARPEKTQLLANYPNPFNPETWIPYELATDTHVRITIYNTQGVVIRSLQFGHQSAGYYVGRDRAAYWDGRNALGEQVASGLYFYQLETDEMSSMRKMVILK